MFDWFWASFLKGSFSFKKILKSNIQYRKLFV